MTWTLPLVTGRDECLDVPHALGREPNYRLDFHMGQEDGHYVHGPCATGRYGQTLAVLPSYDHRACRSGHRWAWCDKARAA